MPPKPAGILALIGGAPKSEDKGAPVGAAEPSGKEAAIRDFFAAGKSGDYAAAAEAFQRAYDECAMGGDVPEEAAEY